MIKYKGFSFELFHTRGAIISPAGFRWDPFMCCVDRYGKLLKERLIRHIDYSREIVSRVFGISDFQISMRLWPQLWNDRDFSVNPEISPWIFRDGRYDLDTFNESYFQMISELVVTACSKGVFVYPICLDDCHQKLPNSPWRLNHQGVNGIYDRSEKAQRIIDAWVRKLLAAATTYTQQVSNAAICPRDNVACDGRFGCASLPGSSIDLPIGAELINEPDNRAAVELSVQIMRILQEERFQRLVTPFRTIIGARALRPGNLEENQIFRDISYGLYQAGLRGPGVSGTMLFKTIHNFGELSTAPYITGALGRAAGSDGCFLSTDGDYPKPGKESLAEIIYGFLSHRSPRNNRAFQGRPFSWEALVDDPADENAFEGICAGIKKYIDEGDNG